MEPHRVYKIKIGQLYTSNVFKAGHRIRIQISSSMAPHYDRNPNTGNEIASDSEMVPANNSVYHDSSRPSRVILPIIPPAISQ
ncbi:MAG: hypothetical protein RLZZ241_1281 [Bacteroidota bacterium]